MSSGNTQASAINQPRNDAFQLAVWKLEGELSAAASAAALDAYNNNAQAKAWVALAIAQSASWADPGNVAVLNLFTGYDPITGIFSGPGQDQLYLRPVPEPGTLGVIAAGIAGLGLARRRKAKAT
jgi:hypothetical protein